MHKKLYYHKTDGGAEYLTDKGKDWSHNGKSGKEGVFKGSKIIVRIDGDIEKDAEISFTDLIQFTKPEKKYLLYILDTGFEIDPNLSPAEWKKEDRLIKAIRKKIYEEL